MEARGRYSVNNTQGLSVSNSTSIGPINYIICDELWDPYLLAMLQNATNATSSGGSSTSGPTSTSKASSGA